MCFIFNSKKCVVIIFKLVGLMLYDETLYNQEKSLTVSVQLKKLISTESRNKFVLNSEINREEELIGWKEEVKSET